MAPKNLSNRSKLTVKVAGLDSALEESSRNSSIPLTDKELMARRIGKKANSASGVYTNRVASYMTGDIAGGSGGNWYSPQLSTDFLEKPQNLKERRAWYRHFYNSSELIGAAIDLHSTIPLSKIRLIKPRSKNPHVAEYSYRFFSRMTERLKMLKTLTEISHEYWLFGNCVLYTEDHLPYADLNSEAKESLKARGKAQSNLLWSKFKVKDVDPNYVGWRKITVLPPDQVRISRMPFADSNTIEYIPDSDTKAAISQGYAPEAYSHASNEDSMTMSRVPSDMSQMISENGTVFLQQDPNKGSFATHLARKKSQYETMGVSILERCINTLLVKDKLRQAQTSIASRHMTPTRVVWGENLNDGDVDDLRTQVDLALMDPDYSIVSNYQINWEEYGSNQRLLDLTSEFERYDSDLYAGLGVTKEMMTGEASYSGSKISLELLNIQYLQYRDMLQEFVEKSLFEPVARRKGFVEEDEYGNENVIYPKLSFTRMSIRDNDSVFEQVMALYNKGSLPVDEIYDILGMDDSACTSKLSADMFTVRDASFNELLRGAYQAIAQGLAEKTNLLDKAAASLNLSVTPPPPAEGGGDAGGAGLGGMRFASEGMTKLMKLAASKPELLEKLLASVEDTPDMET